MSLLMFYVVVLGELGQEQVHVDVEGLVDVVEVVGMKWQMMDVVYLSYDDVDQGNQLPPFRPTRPPGMHIGRSLLRNTMTRDVEFFHLFFTFEMVLEIVNNTNSYA